MNPLTLPLLPVRGVIRIAGLIREQAERELHDPAAARRELEELDQEVHAGKISPEDAAAAEAETAGRLTGTAGLPAGDRTAGDRTAGDRTAGDRTTGDRTTEAE